MRERKNYWGVFCAGVLATLVVQDWLQKGRELNKLKQNEANKK